MTYLWSTWFTMGTGCDKVFNERMAILKVIGGPSTWKVGRGLVYVNQSKYYSATYDILS